MTIIDATCIQRYVLGIEMPSFNKAAADVDSDDEVTIVDATWVQRAVLGIYTPFDIKV